MDDIHDIKAPLTISFNYLPLIILFVIFIIIIIVLVYLSLKRKKALPPPEEEGPATIKLTPREIAVLELEKIKRDRLIELNKTDIFYNRITEILKRYLTEQYGIEVDSKTSTEIIFQLKSLQLNYDFVRQIIICLRDLDFAKYAFYKTSNKDMTESLDLMYTLFKLEGKIQNGLVSTKINLKQ
jgi:hypothetical protein